MLLLSRFDAHALLHEGPVQVSRSASFPTRGLSRRIVGAARADPEFELVDTGVFDENRYFDVFAEYAKASPDDVLIRITVANRGPEAATIHVLPTLWFRNTWSWGCTHEGCEVKPRMEAAGPAAIVARHVSLGEFRLDIDQAADGGPAELVFTDNETNARRVFGFDDGNRYVKDAFHDYVIHGDAEAVNPRQFGTKAAAIYRLTVPAGAQTVVRLRLTAVDEADERTVRGLRRSLREAHRRGRRVLRRAHPCRRRRSGGERRPAGVCRAVVEQAVLPLRREGLARWRCRSTAAAASAAVGRNHDWPHLFNRDVISMPDKWEYPWYAAWDLAFHMIPMATVDPEFAKGQLELFLREWYLHPNGQMPAYEWALSDVNPPVHAWACWRVYKMTAPRGERDVAFLKRVFTKLLLNFTWWVNRKDVAGNHLFAGGFLGLDNIGVFDRSKPLPGGGRLEQADGTAWMAFYASTMLAMALELAQYDDTYEDIASKFFEHFVHIADAMNTLGGMGLWHEDDGFYYDQLKVDDTVAPLGIRSIVGIIPLFAVEVLEQADIDRLPGFRKRMEWFLKYRPDLGRQSPTAISSARWREGERHARRCRSGPPTAGDSIAGAAGTGAALPLRRKRIPVAARHTGVVALSSRSPLRAAGRWSRTSRGLHARRVHNRLVWRQFQLARADLVPGELSRHRGPGTISPFLRRRSAGGVPDGIRPAHESLRSVAGAAPPSCASCSCPTLQAAAPATATTSDTPAIRTGATCRCSTNTSTATRAAALAQAIKPDGRHLSQQFFVTFARQLAIPKISPRSTQWKHPATPMTSFKKGVN